MFQSESDKSLLSSQKHKKKYYKCFLCIPGEASFPRLEVRYEHLLTFIVGAERNEIGMQPQ